MLPNVSFTKISVLVRDNLSTFTIFQICQAYLNILMIKFSSHWY